MKKKTYKKPSMRVECFKQQPTLLKQTSYHYQGGPDD